VKQTLYGPRRDHWPEPATPQSSLRRFAEQDFFFGTEPRCGRVMPHQPQS
jgi:hypothetical protein